ncbi:MAG TPA: multicopper oxidase family protein [Gemmatimonadales bacterium]
MSPLIHSGSCNRRDFLESSLAIAGGAAFGLSATACAAERVLQPDTSGTRAEGSTPDLPEPAVLASVGGVLTAAITATTRPATIAGRRLLQPVTYNGTFPGPTLRVRPGDYLDIAFTNRIVFDQSDTRPGYGRPPRRANMSNLHYHGMHVPPTGMADNMLLMVPPNGRQRYLFQIPADHPAGLFWYHEHVHGLVTNHVGRGAAGMIYVANAYTDQLAALGIRHRLMMLQQAFLEPGLDTLTSNDSERDDPDRALSLINGRLMPELRMRPGEPQVWSLLNASTSAFYALRLEGHTFDVVADDGVPLQPPGRLGQETLVLPSGKRLEVVVRAARSPRRYTLSYDSYDQGVDTWPAKTIGTVTVEGPAWDGRDHPGPDTSTPAEDLSGVFVPPELHRTIVFGQNDSVPEGEFGRFTINGHAWDPAYSEWTSTLGTVEEWLIRNETEQEHPFHVHVNPFQITRRNGATVPFDGHQDVAIIPRFGSLTVRTRFRDFTGGPILMHCHILDHEDMGMMTRFEIASATV